MSEHIEFVEGEETGGDKRVLIPVALAAFITGLDNTIVTVAAPVIGRELDLSFTQLEWVATAYILTFSSLMLVGGRLTDRFGRRRILQVGLAIFLASSVLAALAPNGEFLILFRGLQGIGGALVLPATFAVIATDLTGQNRHLGSGVLMAAIASSLALGPLVGGLFSEHVDWRWIFWINLPLVAGTMWLITRTMASSELAIFGPDGEPPAEGTRRAVRLQDPRVRRAAAWRGLDTPGLIMVSIALTAITFVLVQGHAHGYTSPSILGAGVVGIASLVAFVVVESRGTHPLIDVSLFKNRVVAGGTVVQTLWGLGINGVFFFTSLFLQNVLGFSPTAAGLCFMPLAIALVVSVPVAAWLAVRIGAHRTVALGMFLMALALFYSGFIGRGASFVDLLPQLVVLGFGSALTTPLTSAIFEAVPEKQAGVASALVSTFREMSGVLGIAITGAVLVARESAALSNGANEIDAFTSGYHTALFSAAVLVAGGATVAYITLNVHKHPADVVEEDLEDEESADEPWYREPVEVGRAVRREREPDLVDLTEFQGSLVVDVRDERDLDYDDLSDLEWPTPEETAPGSLMELRELTRRSGSGRRAADPRPAAHGDWVATSERRAPRRGRHAGPLADEEHERWLAQADNTARR